MVIPKHYDQNALKRNCGMLRPIDIIRMPTLWCPSCPFVQNFGGSLAQRQQYDKHRCRHMIIKYCCPLSQLIIIWHGEMLNDLGQADCAVAELVETVQRLLGTPVCLFGSRGGRGFTCRQAMPI